MNLADVSRRPHHWRVWLTAARPKTLTAAIIPIFVASALAYREIGELRWNLIFSALAGAILIQIGTNLINDALDFKKGADTNERIGPLRVTQSGLLTPKQVLSVGFACFSLAAICAIPLIYSGGLPIIAVLALSVLCGYLYTGGPYPLAYVGAGDLFVLLFFGVIAVCTMFFLQTGYVNLSSVIAGVQVGLLATVMIAINNLRDHAQDAKANKKTIPVRFGVKCAKIVTMFCTLTPFALGRYWVLAGVYHAALYPLLLLPLAVGLCVLVATTEPSPKYNRFLGFSALLHLTFGALLAFGL